MRSLLPALQQRVRSLHFQVIPDDKMMNSRRVWVALRHDRLTSSAMPCVSQVMAQRKGLRNQFRSFLGIRKSGSSSGLSPEPARSGAVSGRYDASTAEFQLRQLADTAFMLQVQWQTLLLKRCSAPIKLMWLKERRCQHLMQ